MRNGGPALGSGGKGGSVPVVLRDDAEVPSTHLHHPEGQYPSIADTLLACGLWVHSRTSRQNVAEAMERAGVNGADVVAIVEWFQQHAKPDESLRFAGDVFKDPKRAAEMADDLRKVRLRMAPGESIRRQNTAIHLRQWDEHDARRVAYAIVVADRKPVSEAAEVLRCSEEQVAAYVEAERAARGGEVKRARMRKV